MTSMPADSNTFIHSGIVSKINGSSIIVALDQNIHCESCRAKALCGVSDSASKEIEVTDPSNSFKVNEAVEVTLRKSLGHKAVFWAYVFPFIIMIATLLIASSIFEEWFAGLLSLFILIPYYVLIHLLNNHFKKTFKVSISRTH
ncbi:SoxR reducing system RseC family protein [Flagellimonas nanhaiensis]|nr:SoxR reducing system RseC family protein [Allomuricauda nanhaiensis]